MTALLDAIVQLALLLLGGIAVIWGVRALFALARLSPLPPLLKDWLARVAPAIELVVGVAYVASSLAYLFEHDRWFAWIVLALFVALVVLSWSALYDLVSGVAFRVAQVCHEGDLVQVGDVEGRVLRIGTRALVLQTREGDEAVVPYGAIARRALRRTQSVHGAYVHAFELDQPVEEGFAELKQRVIDAALRCHWASVVHEPKVERREGTRIEVTVYAHDADHAPRVEAAIRRALDGGGASPVVRPSFATPPPSPEQR